jgi:hypothetical protein
MFFGMAIDAYERTLIADPAAAYNAIVKNVAVLQSLGKALFWDTQVGNGNHQACASCHFHAGADSRTVNQLSPGVNVQPTGDNTFGNAAGKTGSGAMAGPNYALTAADYPFHRLANVNDRESPVLFDMNHVTGSQGAFSGNLVTSADNNVAGKGLTCVATPGAPFAIMVNGTAINTRKDEPRNTPTNIRYQHDVGRGPGGDESLRQHPPEGAAPSAAAAAGARRPQPLAAAGRSRPRSPYRASC